MNAYMTDMTDIINETDLHVAVVKYIRENYPQAIIVPGLGEYQNTKELRLECWKKAYTKGQPDLLIPNSSMGDGAKGLAIEFKSPKGTNEASLEQKRFLARLRKQGWLAGVCDNYEKAIFYIKTYFKFISSDDDCQPSSDNGTS